MGTDSSHPFRMTSYGLTHHDSKPSSSLRVIPDRPPSFWTEASIPYKKAGEAKQWHEVKNLLPRWRFIGFLNTITNPSHSFGMTLNVSLIIKLFPPIVILNGGKNALWERREMGWWGWVKNLWHWWRLAVLYKDHGVGRQKELLAHAVRLRILACRNDLNRKRIVSL